MTEDEHRKLVRLGDQFCKDLAIAAGMAIGTFPPGKIRDEVKVYLQDHTSLYSPYTSDMIDEFIRKGSLED